MFEYNTSGTCSKKITFSIENGCLRNVTFYSGCDGNLKALSRLVEGAPVQEVIQKLSGLRCGSKKTSCADQLTKALQEATKA